MNYSEFFFLSSAPVRGKELLEKKMKQVFEKKKSVQSTLDSLRSDKNESQVCDSRSSSKDDSSKIMLKQPTDLLSENPGVSNDHSTESLHVSSLSFSAKLPLFDSDLNSISNNGKSSICPEISSSGMAFYEPTICESKCLKATSTLSLPVVEVSQSQKEKCQSFEKKTTEGVFSQKMNKVQEMSVKRQISDIDSTSNNQICCKKLRFEKNKDQAVEVKNQPKLNDGSIGDIKTLNMNISKTNSSSNKPNTSKLRYKSVLQCNSHIPKR